MREYGMEIVLVVVVSAVVAAIVTFATRPRGARVPAIGSSGAAAAPRSPVAVKAAGHASTATADTNAVTEQQPSDAQLAMLRAELDEELRTRRAEIARIEERMLTKEESIDVRLADLERRERSLDDRARNLDNQGDQLKASKQEHLRELERIAGLSAAQARQLLMRELEEQLRHD